LCNLWACRLTSFSKQPRRFSLEELKRFWGKEIPLDAIKKTCFDQGSGHLHGVLTNGYPAIEPGTAAISLLVHNDIFATARSTHEQPGEEVFRPATSTRIGMESRADSGTFACNLLLSCLHTSPQLIINDTQVWGRGDNPLALIAPDTLVALCVRMLLPSEPAPTLLPDIQHVVQQPGALLRVAMQGAGAPCRRTGGTATIGGPRRWNTLSVQLIDDLHR
jgi:hypothetical protein